MVLGENGWVYIGKDEKDANAIKVAGKTMTVEAGKTLEVPTDGFAQLAADLLQEIEQQIAEQGAQAAA